MKKTALLLPIVAGLLYVTLSSNDANPSITGIGNRTGAKASTANCAGSGCHTGTAPAPTIGIRVDSVGGVQVSKFVPGMTYTVTVTGSHTTNTKFGFQFAAVTGTGASQTQSGTFPGSMPSSVAKNTFSGLSIIEHSAVITGPLSKSFTWQAPTVGGSPIDIKMYLTVNAVNGTGSADGSDVSGNTSITLAQWVTPSAVANVDNGISVKAYPNPVTDVLNIQANAYDTYTVQVYDMAGRMVNAGATNVVTGASTISTSGWATGMYNVVVSNVNGSKTVQVAKQ